QVDGFRILGLVVDTVFVMQMRPGRQSGRADIADDIALLHLSADGLPGRKAGHVAVAGCDASAMVEFHQVAVATLATAMGNRAVTRSVDRGARGRCIIRTVVGT